MISNLALSAILGALMLASSAGNVGKASTSCCTPKTCCSSKCCDAACAAACQKGGGCTDACKAQCKTHCGGGCCSKS